MGQRGGTNKVKRDRQRRGFAKQQAPPMRAHSVYADEIYCYKFGRKAKKWLVALSLLHHNAF
jgi:hypothetical protein